MTNDTWKNELMYENVILSPLAEEEDGVQGENFAL